jgi:hypothetical protein
MPDATDFLRTNQIGQQEDLEFTNANSGPTLYVMRGQGFPTSSADTKAIVTYGYVQGNLLTKQQYFSGSQSASLDGDGNQVFQVSLAGTGSQNINGDTLEIYLNGLALRRNEVPNVHSSDYFKSDTDKVTIYKVTGSYGYNLKDEDRIKIRFNQGL